MIVRSQIGFSASIHDLARTQDRRKRLVEHMRRLADEALWALQRSEDVTFGETVWVGCTEDEPGWWQTEMTSLRGENAVERGQAFTAEDNDEAEAREAA